MITSNFQLFYDLPDGYDYFCVNRNGTLVAFVNPPIRDFDYGEWIDSVDGSTGTIIPYEKWDVCLKCRKDIRDQRHHAGGRSKQRDNIKVTERYRRSLRQPNKPEEEFYDNER